MARLSSAMLCGGHEALRRARWPWWILLLGGTVAALPLAVILAYMSWRGEFGTGFPSVALFAGPPILAPALYLLYLRITCHRNAAPLKAGQA
ncbi:MAG: hypothetical protein ACOH1V_08995 [Stenotrophomonas sp.]